MKKRIYLLSTLLPVLGFLFAPPALSAEADLVKAERYINALVQLVMGNKVKNQRWVNPKLLIN